jgi:phage tail sheath protein FI
MPSYKTPVVYVEELQKSPPVITSVDTAIPAFIGYTQKAQLNAPNDLLFTPTRISSLLEYEQCFGLPSPETTIQLSIDTTQANKIDVKGEVLKPSNYRMYYSLQLFFANGGGACYIVSVGRYSTRGTIGFSTLRKGLKEAARVNDATLILFPDALNMASAANYYTLHKDAMLQAASRKDCFVVMDIWVNPKDAMFNPVQSFREFDFGGTEVVRYGAAYYPRIRANLHYYFDQTGSRVKIVSKSDRSLNGTLKALKEKSDTYYAAAVKAISDINMLLPVSSAVVGVYAHIDSTRGVWKAPANVAISCAVAPEIIVTDKQQEDLNVDVNTGKSINVIRSFAGRGSAIIWGARTLAGNDNEWRYVPVRRFFSMVEKSIKNAVEPAVFEPNDVNTWVRIKTMVENYLMEQWRAGALVGNKPEHAFYVKIGVGETMTAVDVLEGRMIIAYGLAVVRPGEFIVQRSVLKMLANV